MTKSSKHTFRNDGLLDRAAAGIGRLVKQGPLRASLRRIYHFLLMKSTGGKGLTSTLPGGEVVHILPGYRFAAWDYQEYAAFKAATHPGGIAVDVGANIGAYTTLFGYWVGQAGSVYAFEPAEETYSALVRHIALNGLDSVVKPVRCAVSDKSGVRGFSGVGFHGTNSFVVSPPGENRNNADAVYVETVAIDDFCETHRIIPDVLKIDIEGFELEALRGARRTIAKMARHSSIFVELHPTTWSAIGVQRADLEEEFELQGLVAMPLVDGSDVWKMDGICVRLVHKPAKR